MKQERFESKTALHVLTATCAGRFKPIRVRRSMLVAMAGMLFLSASLRGGTIPAPVAEVVRQLEEWRGLSQGWLEEAQRLYPTNESDLALLKMNYIEAQAIANSLIGKLQLETAARTPLKSANYDASAKRAQAATRALVEEGKRLLLATMPKTRGATQPDDPAKLVLENAQKSLNVAGGLLDMFSKNRRSFLELDVKQRDEIRKILDTKKWEPLEKVMPRKPAGDQPKDVPANATTPAAPPAAK